MTSLSTNHLAFPGNLTPLTERRVAASAWANALYPYLRYVSVVTKDGSPAVLAENGKDLVLTLTESDEKRGHWPLWTLEVYSRRNGVEYAYKVGNLQDVLVSLLREL
nr:MAG TPA: hypothetical protein [Caudoviricetes sp.]